MYNNWVALGDALIVKMELRMGTAVWLAGACSLPQKVRNEHPILMILHSEGSSFSLCFPRETVSFSARNCWFLVQNAHCFGQNGPVFP